MIIDFHTHVFSPKVITARDEYIRRDPLFRLLYSNSKAKLATAEELLQTMDAQGIDVSVIQNIAWSSPELCYETNEYIMEAAARYPQRLIGFGMVVLDSEETALEEIEHCVRGGMKGIGEIRPGRALLTSPESVKQVIQKIEDNNLVLLTHVSEPVGHIYSGKGDITPEALYPFIVSFPRLKLVCAHWGGGMPFYALMPEVKIVLKRVYFDTAASPYLYGSQVYPQVAQLIGSDKILFGSDYPLIKPKRLLTEIEALNLPEDLKNAILAGNAESLLKL
jgi:uncharacterized protein